MSTKKIKWAEVVRQSTGTHPMDSGGIYGRHWQRPLPEREIQLHGDIERRELHVSIALHAFLDEHFEIDQRLTRWLRKQDANNYQEYADALAAKLDKSVRTSDYTYNWENDLTQDFQFSVLSAKDDWYYDADAVLIIETHNGADARGGFSDPVVCRPIDRDGATWLDVVCGVSFTHAVDSAGAECKPHELDEQFQVGYTSNPTYDFNKEIAKIHSFDADANKFDVTLKSGHRVQGYFYARDSSGDCIT